MRTRSALADHRHEHSSHERTLLQHLLGRWPAVLGLLALVSNVATGADPHVTAMIIVIASVCYLAASAIGSQRSGWAMVGGAGAAVVLARLAGVDPTATVLALGVAFAVVGYVRRGAVDRHALIAQTLAFLGFSALALVAMIVDPVAALLLAAVAAIGHAGWDVVHHVRNTVVPRSLAEACFLLDLGLGLALLLLAVRS